MKEKETLEKNETFPYALIMWAWFLLGLIVIASITFLVVVFGDFIEVYKGLGIVLYIFATLTIFIGLFMNAVGIDKKRYDILGLGTAIIFLGVFGYLFGYIFSLGGAF